MIVITIVTNSIELIPIWDIYIPLSWGLGEWWHIFYFGLICYNFFLKFVLQKKEQLVEMCCGKQIFFFFGIPCYGKIYDLNNNNNNKIMVYCNLPQL